MIIVSAILAALWTAVFLRTYKGLQSVPDLPKGVSLPEKPPLVSVIIAAKEEQETIGETVRHLLQQSYPRMEIIAVNDRSGDATGARLDELKSWSAGKEHSRIPLKVIHITSLPDGWLGKNHALYQGYLHSRGSFLLFTDADVRFHPDAVRDSVAYALSEGADHVTLSPKLVSKSFWLRAFVHYFLFSLFMLLSPWRANDDRNRSSGMGIGAFNLLRRSAYETIGTHAALAMRPDDDLRLGVLVKRRGFKQRLAAGTHRIAVEWYTSLRAAARGLEKNLYSGFGYRLALAAAAMCGQLLLFAGPFLMLSFARGAALAVLFAVCALIVAVYVLCVRRMNKERGEEAAVLPISALLLTFVLARSVWLAHRRSGVNWRGTFYSLDDLRRLYKS
ncbi:glycosyltransferase [Paenibacillus thermotolerans]|uniref:glycosyltransferase n=1 Tax=Paenibacillus thermotolerans TaxID=3027807 RepID=UPI002367F91A|nr:MULTISPECIES: glycosyltransferase family 2 protein [unclassified Paenibacillus]